MADMQSCQNKVAVILPSLDPDAKFTRVVEGLVENGFQHVVIVDDGSSAERQRFFEEAARHPECTVIHHGESLVLKDGSPFIRTADCKLRAL